VATQGTAELRLFLFPAIETPHHKADGVVSAPAKRSSGEKSRNGTCPDARTPADASTLWVHRLSLSSLISITRPPLVRVLSSNGYAGVMGSLLLECRPLAELQASVVRFARARAWRRRRRCGAGPTIAKLGFLLVRCVGTVAVGVLQPAPRKRTSLALKAWP